MLFFTGVLALGILSQWVAWRLRLPSILLLLAAGVASRLIWDINPDDVIGQDVLFSVVSLSVAVILFEGGLTLQLHELKDAGSMVFRLISIGALVTWGLTTSAAAWIFDMDLRVAALLGAILVVTGPTVIAPLLRHIRPKRNVASIVKWEGIVIDPIGAVLAVLVFSILTAALEDPTLTWMERTSIASWVLAKTVAVGVVVSIAAALMLVLMMQNYWVPDFLHNAFFLAVALFGFTLSNYWQEESGLLTVTLLGIFLANQKTVPVQHVLEFKENLRVLLISCLFIVLAARIDIAQIVNLQWRGALFLTALIVIIRPLSVFASAWGTKLKWNERLFLAALAPRGIVAAAVSAIFALHLSTHGGHAVTETPSDELVERPATSMSAATTPYDPELHAPMPVFRGAEDLVPITFLVIMGTVAIYGLVAAPLARWLELAVPNPQGVMFAGASPWARAIAEALVAEQIPVIMVDTNFQNIAAARMEGVRGHCASVLSEYVCEEMDLAGIGRMFAVTPNEDLNRLATLEFSHDFGRAEVYELAPWGNPSARREPTSHLQARTLFSDEASYSSLAARHAQGEVVKRTRLSDEFTFDDFLRTYGEDALILFAKTESGELQVKTAEKELEPLAGSTVFAFVKPDND
ncbi:MAG: sodium:proton antiporter [Planctomycetota bacterium]